MPSSELSPQRAIAAFRSSNAQLDSAGGVFDRGIEIIFQKRVPAAKIVGAVIERFHLDGFGAIVNGAFKIPICPILMSAVECFVDIVVFGSNFARHREQNPFRAVVVLLKKIEVGMVRMGYFLELGPLEGEIHVRSSCFLSFGDRGIELAHAEFRTSFQRQIIHAAALNDFKREVVFAILATEADGIERETIGNPKGIVGVIADRFVGLSLHSELQVVFPFFDLI